MKEKKKHRVFSIAMTALLALSMCLSAAIVSAEEVSAASAYYSVSVHPSEGGTLYWNYDTGLNFFYQGKGTYRKSCRIDKAESRSFSILVDHGIIAKADKDWYFDGFYDRMGTKLSLKGTNIEIIRITVDGRYFYDYIPSYDNPEYKNYSQTFFKSEVKDYIEFLYGTRQYKVMEKTVLYQIPKKAAAYYPKFKELKAPDFPGKLTLEKSLDAEPFYAAGKAGFAAKYSSSNSKVIKVNKESGLCQVTGPGAATITVKTAKTDTAKACTYKVRVTVKPDGVTGLSASRTSDKKYVSLKWKADSRCSGYEVQISDTKSFSKITAKKTVTSGKTGTTKVSTAKSAVCKYIRIRPYKKAGGEKLYGPYITAQIR